MSLPEVEDVVSSIRRLVSPDHRPRSRLLPEKLLLTPSFQVVSDAAPEPDAGQPEAGQPDAGQPEAGQPEAGQPEAGLETSAAVDDNPVMAVAEHETVAEEAFHSFEAEWEDEDWSDPEPPLAEFSEQIEDAEVIPGSSVTAEVSPDQWLADAALPEAAVSEAALPDAALPDVAVPDAVLPDAQPEPALPDLALADDAWQQAETDWVEEAPIPFAVHLRPVPVAPDDADDVGQAAPSIEVEAEAEVAPEAAGPDFAVEDAAEPEPGLDAELAAEASGAIDEDLLQALVRDLIRDELHGALGERITRNVRKLVRAEINRALASRSFD